MKPSYVFVVPWRPTYGGGVNEVVLNLYGEMLRAGEMRPLLLVTEWSAVRPIETTSEGRDTVLLRLWAPSSVLGAIKWLLAAPLSLIDLWRFCRRHRVVAFNFHFPSLNAFPIAVLRWLRVYRGALILSFHGLDLRDARIGAGLTRRLWRFVLRRATAIVACSRAFAAEVGAFVGNSVVTIHNGVQVPDAPPQVDRTTHVPNSLENREFILSVATFEHKKGLDVLLRAFAALRRTRPATLVLVGRSGAAEDELRALAVALGVENDVFFFTNVPHAEIKGFLDRAAVFCLPSRAEPFGIVILEAGAARLPVVASRVGGIPEVITHGETGLLVEPADPQALAAALQRVLDDPGFGRALGERLHQHVTASFSWRRAHESYRALVPRLGSVRSA